MARMTTVQRLVASMTLAELVDLRNDIEGRLNAAIGREQSELQTRLDALSALFQVTSARTNGAEPPRRAAKAHPLKGTKAPIKYRGPNGETWTGRGNTPRWLTELEGRGRAREGYLI